MIVTGLVLKVDIFNKIRILVTDKLLINDLINNINERYTKPYKINRDSIECIINIKDYLDYYTTFINNNIDNTISIDVNIKKYTFNGKRGTSLILKEIIN